MALDQHASNLVDVTVNAFNGESTSVSPVDGISLIDSWITALRGDDKSNISVANGLSELKAELQSSNPNGWHVRGILENLLNQVKETAKSADEDVKEKLDTLVDALDGFSHQLGGSSKPANTGGQAPMTSTVGGESTNSGTGTSATDTDDTTIGDGDTRYTGGTVDDDYSPASGTRSSGVSSDALPDHNARDESETDTGSSGGRSQY
ncbi:hypothetical protein [Spirosoma agri]|uniref:Uncharacterized protein n=1 Tax=Spirosoma agri TaxID=1987381 RepID=A0A6M0ILU5_9BACT|nr:hypothetical protein [Spirosoma agri]NEU69286.1 hypothetical protein [Spirosoma agri]